MYCIKKFVDCWAVFNLDNNRSRALTEAEVAAVGEEVAALKDPGTLAYYTDIVNCLPNKP